MIESTAGSEEETVVHRAAGLVSLSVVLESEVRRRSTGSSTVRGRFGSLSLMVRPGGEEDGPFAVRVSM